MLDSLSLLRAMNGIRQEDVIMAENASLSGSADAHRKTRRIVALAIAAALILALGVSACAAGFARSVGTHPMPEAGEYRSLSDLPEVERLVGYPVTVPESFSNGYRFTLLRVDGQAVFGESNQVLREYYICRATYSKPGAAEIYLVLSPVPEDAQGVEDSGPGRSGGASVSLSLDHYKVVPEGYEKTPEDLAAEAKGHYYISFGGDEILEYDFASAGFQLDGVEYALMDMAAREGSLDTLARMAEELLAAAAA